MSTLKTNRIENRAGTAGFDVDSIPGVGSLGFRNKIINGDFRIFQRQADFGSDLAMYPFISDRWKFGSDTSTVAMYMGSSAQRPTPQSEGAIYISNIQNMVTEAWLYQNIEGAKTLGGGKAAIQAWVRAENAIEIEAVLDSRYDDGTPIDRSERIPLSVPGGSVWTKFEFVIDVPISDTASMDNSYNQFTFAIPAGSSGTLWFGDVQIEQGEIHTAFERRPMATELNLCQRYYEKSHSLTIYPGAATYSGAVGFTCARAVSNGGTYCGVDFKVSKRKAANCNTYSVSSGTPGTIHNSRLNNSYGATTSNESDNGFWVLSASGTSAQLGDFIAFTWTADAEL